MQKILTNLFFLIALTHIGLSQTSFEFGIDSDEDCTVTEATVDVEVNSVTYR